MVKPTKSWKRSNILRVRFKMTGKSRSPAERDGSGATRALPRRRRQQVAHSCSSTVRLFLRTKSRRSKERDLRYSLRPPAGDAELLVQVGGNALVVHLARACGGL